MVIQANLHTSCCAHFHNYWENCDADYCCCYYNIIYC